jgi:hypothetical protein
MQVLPGPHDGVTAQASLGWRRAPPMPRADPCDAPRRSGLVAIPRAYLALGVLLGTTLLLGTAALVATTKSWLVAGYAAHPKAMSYAALARATCGRHAGLVTHAAIVAFCFGFLVVDLVRCCACLRGAGAAATLHRARAAVHAA